MPKRFKIAGYSPFPNLRITQTRDVWGGAGHSLILILKYGNFRTRPSDTRHFCQKKDKTYTPYHTFFRRFDVSKYDLGWFRPGCGGNPPIKHHNHWFLVHCVLRPVLQQKSEKNMKSASGFQGAVFFQKEVRKFPNRGCRGGEGPPGYP